MNDADRISHPIINVDDTKSVVVMDDDVMYTETKSVPPAPSALEELVLEWAQLGEP